MAVVGIMSLCSIIFWLIVRIALLVWHFDVMHCHQNQDSNERQVSKVNRVIVSILHGVQCWKLTFLRLNSESKGYY